MQRRYRRANHPNPQNLLGCTVGGLAGVTGICTTHNSDNDNNGREEKQCFTVLTQDLVCFQMDDFIKIDLGDLDLAFVKKRYRKVEGVEHVALEFDPSWDIPKESDFIAFEMYDSETTGHALVRTRLKLSGTIWFIDYRIRRSKDPSQSRVGIRHDRHVFHGNGCRFVSVYPSDMEWEYEDGTPLSAEGHNVFFFVSELGKADFLYGYRMLNDRYEVQAAQDDFRYRNLWEEKWFHDGRDTSYAKLGVLACEVYGEPAGDT
ncbi:hypothetical protein F5Y13DRAFT_167019 [Hypoxylon sp. FL1857]|nr:hypothetical protein F5Y13DRAFT_167019 [Hypoxylon sp. FL1857]